MPAKPTTEQLTIPATWQARINKQIRLKGHVFSKEHFLAPALYIVRDVRWGSATIRNMETGKAKHPTIELLLYRQGFRRAKWSRGFACREIDLREKHVAHE